MNWVAQPVLAQPTLRARVTHETRLVVMISRLNDTKRAVRLVRQGESTPLCAACHVLQAKTFREAAMPIHTVLGPIAPDDLGFTSMHEHLFLDARCLYTPPSEPPPDGDRVTPRNLGFLK